MTIWKNHFITRTRSKNQKPDKTKITYKRMYASIVVKYKFNTKKREAYAKDEFVSLTRKENGILEYLLLNQGRPVSQEELIEHVWDASVDSFSCSIRVHMSSLRKKLKQFLDMIQSSIRLVKVIQSWRKNNEKTIPAMETNHYNNFIYCIDLWMSDNVHLSEWCLLHG